MSRSFNLSVTLNCRVVFSEDELKEVTEAIEEARKYVASENQTDKQRLGVCKAILAAEPKGLDAILSVFLKDTAKQFRQIIVDETKGDNFKDFAPPVVVITPRVNSGPKNCQGCIRPECSRPEGKANAGCPEKQTGVREPVNLDIPMTAGERIASCWDAGDV